MKSEYWIFWSSLDFDCHVIAAPRGSQALFKSGEYDGPFLTLDEARKVARKNVYDTIREYKMCLDEINGPPRPMSAEFKGGDE